MSDQKTQQQKDVFKFPNKLTKIVATIGPATETKEVLRDLILSGMNVARFNSKHGTPEWHHERMIRVKEVARELNTPVGVLLDLQGPEVRITLPKEAQEDGYSVKNDEVVVFADQMDLKIDGQKMIYLPENIVDSIQVGQTILIDDGLCQLEVSAKKKDMFEAKAQGDFIIKNRKTTSFPGFVTDMPVLIENDYLQLDGIRDEEVDFVALSFVRNKSDILTLRRELDKRNLTAGIVAKIENQEALRNLDEIIEASDAVMVARGDLGIEVPYEKLIRYQRKIIQIAREQVKPVITATHMLETMVTNPFPTRAEISDVAHAVYDLTDAVMLSAETTIGKYPVKTVQIQSKIASYNEKYIESDYMECVDGNGVSNVINAVNHLLTSDCFDLDLIICLTETGRTASLVSRSRPKMPIHVITSTQRVYDKLSLTFGLIPHLVDWPKDEKLIDGKALLNKINSNKWLESGKKALVLHGPEWGKPGFTNTVSFLTIE